MPATLLHPPLGQSRYGVLAQALRSRILQGEWAPGDMMPSESSLAASYGVALGTIRQALSLLVEDGVAVRLHGKGTFVTKGMDGASMMRFFRFSDSDAALEPPESHILSSRLRQATDAEAHAFGLGSSGQVFQFERLRTLRSEPCLLESIVLPLPLFGALAESDSSAWDDLLYPMYQARCGVLIHHAQDELSFAQLGAREAKRLRLTAGHPCVRVDRKAYDIAGRCVEMRVTRGDAFSFKYTAQVK